MPTHLADGRGNAYNMKVNEDGSINTNNIGIASSSNTSATNLNSGATYTGTWEQNYLPDVLVQVSTDQIGTLYIEFSNDGVVTDTSIPIKYDNNLINPPQVFVKGPRYFRVRFTNDSASNQTSFRLYTYYGNFNKLTSAISGPIAFNQDATVVRSATEEEVMIGKVQGRKIIHKFGSNSDVDGAEDIWEGGGDYTGFPTAAAENFEILSSSADDTSAGTGARTVRIWYYNDDYEMFDASGNYLMVDVTLNGTAGVDSGVSGMRIWRAKVLTSGSGQINAGDITIRWITTTAKMVAVVGAGIGQTRITSITIPTGYKGYLKSWDVSLNDNNTNRADMAIKVRDSGSNTYRLTEQSTVTTDNDINRLIYGGIEYAEKTDLIFRCTAINNANGNISVTYSLFLIKQ